MWLQVNVSVGSVRSPENIWTTTGRSLAVAEIANFPKDNVHISCFMCVLYAASVEGRHSTNTLWPPAAGGHR